MAPGIEVGAGGSQPASLGWSRFTALVSGELGRGDGDQSWAGSRWKAKIRCGFDKAKPFISLKLGESLIWPSQPPKVSQRAFFLLF